MRLHLFAAVLSRMATFGAQPDSVQPFLYDSSYEERVADPGVVNLACGRQFDEYCGCTDFELKTVWLSRHPKCADHREETRRHEGCHVMLGSSRVATSICHTIFPPRAA